MVDRFAMHRMKRQAPALSLISIQANLLWKS
jgi:hypothetical protein